MTHCSPLCLSPASEQARVLVIAARYRDYLTPLGMSVAWHTEAIWQGYVCCSEAPLPLTMRLTVDAGGRCGTRKVINKRYRSPPITTITNTCQDARGGGRASLHIRETTNLYSIRLSRAERAEHRASADHLPSVNEARSQPLPSELCLLPGLRAEEKRVVKLEA